MPVNLMEAITSEIKRNTELLEVYKNLPNGAGMFGATLINAKIEAAISAVGTGDIEQVLKCYQELKDSE